MVPLPGGRNPLPRPPGSPCPGPRQPPPGGTLRGIARGPTPLEPALFFVHAPAEVKPRRIIRRRAGAPPRARGSRRGSRAGSRTGDRWRRRGACARGRTARARTARGRMVVPRRCFARGSDPSPRGRGSETPPSSWPSPPGRRDPLFRARARARGRWRHRGESAGGAVHGVQDQRKAEDEERGGGEHGIGAGRFGRGPDRVPQCRRRRRPASGRARAGGPRRSGAARDVETHDHPRTTQGRTGACARRIPHGRPRTTKEARPAPQ